MARQKCLISSSQPSHTRRLKLKQTLVHGGRSGCSAIESPPKKVHSCLHLRRSTAFRQSRQLHNRARLVRVGPLTWAPFTGCRRCSVPVWSMWTTIPRWDSRGRRTSSTATWTSSPKRPRGSRRRRTCGPPSGYPGRTKVLRVEQALLSRVHFDVFLISFWLVFDVEMTLPAVQVLRWYFFFYDKIWLMRPELRGEYWIVDYALGLK